MRLGGHTRFRTHLQAGDEEKVQIGGSAELLEQVCWQEAPYCVLGRKDDVAAEIFFLDKGCYTIARGCYTIATE